MKNGKKIEILTILSLIYFVLSLIISLLITCCVITIINKTLIQTLISIPLFVITFLLLGLSVNFLYKTFRKHIFIEKPFICLKCSEENILYATKQNNIRLNSQCVCISKKQKNLKTITIHEITDTLTYDNINKQIKNARNVIKKDFSLPPNPSPADEHWMIDITVILVNKISDDELMNLFSTWNDQFYEIGRYFAVFEKNNNLLYCSIYYGKSLNLVAFLGYKRCQKMLKKLFNAK